MQRGQRWSFLSYRAQIAHLLWCPDSVMKIQHEKIKWCAYRSENESGCCKSIGLSTDNFHPPIISHFTLIIPLHLLKSSVFTQNERRKRDQVLQSLKQSLENLRIHNNVRYGIKARPSQRRRKALGDFDSLQHSSYLTSTTSLLRKRFLSILHVLTHTSPKQTCWRKSLTEVCQCRPIECMLEEKNDDNVLLSLLVLASPCTPMSGSDISCLSRLSRHIWESANNLYSKLFSSNQTTPEIASFTALLLQNARWTIMSNQTGLSFCQAEQDTMIMVTVHNVSYTRWVKWV